MHLVVLASLVPGVFWLWYFLRHDRFEQEPVWEIVKCLFSGALAVLPAIILEYPFRSVLQSPSSLLTRFLLSFFVIGLGEELCKFLALYLTVYHSSEFNEPVDGIMYAVAAAIGFSIVENIMYISAFGFSVAPLRAVVASMAHTSFTGVLGYFFGCAKFSATPYKLLGLGLGTAAFLHGLYDFILIGQIGSPLMAILLVVVFHYVLLKAIQKALALSPFS
ncbi:MAG: PrsW family intramembrane metalloprotease [Firmicutes bacterium]|nr:PrsW family intramembrane metalloprotease [Bacillota bacterium]